MRIRSLEIRRVVFAAFLIVQVLPDAIEAQRSDTIVKMTTASRYRSIASLVEDLSIGVLEGSPEYSFSSIWDIAVADDGSMLILDGGPRQSVFISRPSARLYDARGRFVRNVGAQGEGPGEYRMPSSVAVMPDGKFLLLDRLNQRLTVYSDAGTYDQSWKVRIYSTGLGLPGIMRVDPRGIITIGFRLGGSPNAQRAVVRMKAGGEVIDTIREPRLPDLRVEVTKSRTTFVMPYSPNAFWAWSPLGYSVTGVNTRYALDLMLPKPRAADGAKPPAWRQGDPVVSIRAVCPEVPISSAERADQKAFKDSQLRSVRGQQSGRFPEIPHVKPCLRHVSVADDGRIWVWVHSPSERYMPPQQRTRAGDVIDKIGWREPTLVDVFEADGAYVGRVRFPHELQPLKFRGDQVWGYTLDDVEVPYLKRYHVRWN